VKTVLVTGASRGIGRELALAFGEAGYAVAVNYQKEEAQAAAVVRMLEAPHPHSLPGKRAPAERAKGQAFAIPCDVRDSLKVRQMIDSVVSRWGHLDVLVNNAGITRDRTILKMTNGEWNDVIDTNLSGLFWCLREAARVMSRQKKGAILNMASVAAYRPGFGNANYAAAKAGVLALTKAAARELGRFDVTVNALLPGFHPTKLAAGLTEEQRGRVLAEHVLGRSTAMEDLTRLVIELAENRSVSGQIFNVDSRLIA